MLDQMSLVKEFPFESKLSAIAWSQMVIWIDKRCVKFHELRTKKSCRFLHFQARKYLNRHFVPLIWPSEIHSWFGVECTNFSYFILSTRMRNWYGKEVKLIVLNERRSFPAVQHVLQVNSNWRNLYRYLNQSI